MRTGNFAMTLVAFTTQNRRTITGHAGMCRNFMRFRLAEGAISHLPPLALSMEQRLREAPGAAPHPLDGVDLLITGGMGAGLREKLTRRGIASLVTAESDPLRALALLAQGKLTDAALQTGEHPGAHHCDRHSDH